MDTIFVKKVKEGGPAHQAGLRTGDRLIKVNGESIIGKTYSQVIALIQNSDNVLELAIMPRDEDILQLAYSQDAYLKGNDPYIGEAQNIPEPPPVCYPRKTHVFDCMTQTQEPMVAEPFQGQLVDNKAYRSSSSGPSSPMDSVSVTSPTPSVWGDTRIDVRGTQSSPAHRTEDIHYGMSQSRPPPTASRDIITSSSTSSSNFVPCGPSSSLYGSSAPSFYGRHGCHPAPFANHFSYGAPKPFQDQRNYSGFKDYRETDSHPSSISRPSWERVGSPKAMSKQECQQALSQWFSNQVPRRSSPQDRCYAMPPRYRSFSQDRLGDGPLTRGWPHSASQDTLLESADEPWTYKAKSENHLLKYGHSLEALQHDALTSPRFDRSFWASAIMDRFCRSGPHEHGQVNRPQKGQALYQPSKEPPTHVQKHPSQPNLQFSDDSGYIGYRSYSPSFHRRTGLMSTHSFRDPGYNGPSTFNIPQRKVSQQTVPSDMPLPASSLVSCPPGMEKPSNKSVQRWNVPPDQRMTNHDRNLQPVATGIPQVLERAPKEQEERREDVVLRQKPPTGRKIVPSLRHPHFNLAVDLQDPPVISPSFKDQADRYPSEHTNGRLEAPPVNEDSLASIPFIDEPTSPSADLRARHVPASQVVSISVSSPPAVATSNTASTFTFPTITRHYSQDCSNIKPGRRSSYLLAITTERSKSCDDGLNTYEGKGYPPNRGPSIRILKSFFTDGSLDSLRSEGSRSKRHSTSDLSDSAFSETRKEGWLYYKQILTKKGKKVGSGIRLWKRVYAVLRGHSLFLHKDKREALMNNMAAQPEDEQPISIRGCLTDICYSETKRRHVFRLTTSDFSEYLFQAEDRDDMLGWIKTVRDSSKTEEEDPSSKAIVKLIEYRKYSPSGNKPDSSPKGTHSPGIKSPFLTQMQTNTPWSPKPDSGKDETSPPKAPWNIMKKNKKSAPRVFGVRLEECQPAVNNKLIPLIVEVCCKLVEDKGLDYTGIYRVPGNNAVVSSLQDQLNKGATDINTSDEKWQDLNVISSLLKSFFRKLPEPLFTDDKYIDFIEANRLENAGERLKTMKKLIRDLPGHYYHTLKFLVGHLKTVADHSEKNKMEPRNLALVFGPTLVRTSEDNMTDMVTHMPDRYKIVETLIQHYDWFFSEEEDKDEKTPVETGTMEPAPNIEHLLPNIGRTGALGDASDSTNSDSTRSKGSWGTKKDQYSREFLAASIISAVRRKRKKQRDARLIGSSTDDDSEHEPIKACNKGRPDEGKEGGRKQQEVEEMKEKKEEVGQRNPETEHLDSRGPKIQEASGKEDKKPLDPCSTSKSNVPSAGIEGSVKEKIAQFEQSKSGSFEKEATNLEKSKAIVELANNGDANPSRSQNAKAWRAPELHYEERVPADTRSIVSGYSTLSTIDRSVCSEVQSVAESRGDEADDERSEFSHVETDNESGFASRFLPDRTAHGGFSYNRAKFLSSSTDNDNGTGKERGSASKLHSKPSFNSRKLIQCDTLARKKLTRAKQEGEKKQTKTEVDGLELPNLVEDIKSSKSSSSQESLKPQPEKSGLMQPSKSTFGEQFRHRLRSSADDMFVVGMRKPHSPETRRKKSAWRRHTVVVQSNLKDLNFNEWKEKDPLEGKEIKKPVVALMDRVGHDVVESEDSLSTGGKAQNLFGIINQDLCTKTGQGSKTGEILDYSTANPNKDFHCSNKDSGLSSLESTKARSSSSYLGNSSHGHVSDQLRRDADSTSTQNQPPKRTASSRFPQYL
ncbi:rho GTPase-activating protein 23 [Latimeria chalumnae]|uniref:rho GTPase-activating protein 23 n=1 Tax=Latimeria chalumnae TaxID=7897 RepID=UPI00313E3547